MPLLGSPQLSATARTPAIGSLAELAPLVTEVRSAAAGAGRTEPIDILCSYRNAGLAAPENATDRHLDAFAQLEKAGATWVLVSSDTHALSATLEWIEAFGSTYLDGRVDSDSVVSDSGEPAPR
jgi:hypothetical protein